MYQIRILPKAEKYIKKIKEKILIEKLKNAIIKIQTNPYIGEAKKGDLKGIYGFDIFYHNINYEISYKIYEKENIIVIILIGTRENFYQELKKYLQSN